MSISHEELRQTILATVDKRKGIYGHQVRSLFPGIPDEAVREALKSLVLDGTLRMREDDQEHDWEYVRKAT